MFKPKLNVSKELFEKIKQASELAMCSTPDEWVAQILEEAAEKVINDAGKNELSEADVDDITKKLQGLGYLD